MKTKIIITAGALVATTIITAIWWCFITFIAFVITKSGGTGEWINEFKPYVLAFIFVIVFFIITWVQIFFATAKQKPTLLRSSYR